MPHTAAKVNWQTIAASGEIAGAIEAYVREFDRVTLAELQRRFAEFFETSGAEVILARADQPEIVIWSGASGALKAAVEYLVRTGRVFLHPANPALYSMEGAIPKLPVARRGCPRDSRKPQWIPVCLRPVPFDRAKDIERQRHRRRVRSGDVPASRSGRRLIRPVAKRFASPSSDTAAAS